METTEQEQRKKAQEKIRKEILDAGIKAEMIARAKQTNPLQENQN